MPQQDIICELEFVTYILSTMSLGVLLKAFSIHPMRPEIRRSTVWEVHHSNLRRKVALRETAMQVSLFLQTIEAIFKFTA